MPDLFARFFGALTRFVLAGIVGYLVRKGVIDGSLGEELLVAAAIGIPTLIWSLYQKYKDRLKFKTALEMPAGTTERDVNVIVSNGGGAKLTVLLLLISLSLGSQACGKEQIESAFAKTVVALRSARQVTTVQHKYQHIDDAAYKSRLLLFDSAYDTVNAVGDTVAGFGEVTPGNKQQILDQVNALASTVDTLLADGDVGIKNPKSQAEYRRWLVLSKGLVSSLKIGIAAIDKPTPVKDLKLPKARAD